MTSRHTAGKVRDFEVTLEDAARLARCFNSFDDSDSWPGGFTHGNPFTAERILEDLSKRKKIRTIVAIVDDKIVGHCDLVYGELDPESSYVGLLGVDPAYQGQGFGKALLIEAAETAAREGFRRIDLHSWPGNLKAIPLYKRTGYNWVPATRVLMESHIPGIISCELFQEYFERHNWYDTFKREITQKIDDITEDGLGVFKYRFEAENGDLLDVTVDREAKGICGFTMTVDGKTLSASVKPISHIGYIGIDKTPVTLTLTNDSDTEMPFSLQNSSIQDISVSIEGQITGSISPGESFTQEGEYSISFGAKHIERETNPDEKVKTQVEWTLLLGEKTIKMFSGLIPNEAVTLFSGPAYPTIAPGQTKTISLGIRNNLDVEQSFEIDLSSTDRSDLSRKERVTLRPNAQTEIELEVTAKESERFIDISISIYSVQDSERTLVKSRPLNIGVIGTTGTIARRAIDKFYSIENEGLRFLIHDSPPMVMRYFEHEMQNRGGFGWGMLPYLTTTLGTFPSGGNEWERKNLDVTLDNGDSYSAIKLEGESVERPGLMYTIIYKMYAGSNYLEVSVRLRNTSSQKYEKLGVRMGGWLQYYNNRLYVPLRGDVYEIASAEWNGRRQVSKRPGDFHETWCASQKSDRDYLMGFIWENDGLVEVFPTRGWGMNTVEYKLPDLNPDESVEKMLLRMIVGQGHWSHVRALWARLNGVDIDYKKPVEIRSDLEVEIVPTQSTVHRKGLSPILVDRAKKNCMELRVRVIHELPMKGNIVLTMPQGVLINGEKEISIEIPEISLDKPFLLPVEITADGDDWLRTDGSFEIRFSSRIVRHPFAVVVYDTKAELIRETTIENELELRTLKSGGFQIAASPDYAGALVRYGSEGKSVFRDTFPEAGPFQWWDKYYSGLSPVVIHWGTWDWQTGFHKEMWTIKDVSEGLWNGYQLENKLEHSPGAKGMTFRVRYMMLTGTPLVQMRILGENTSGLYRRIRFGFWGVPQLNDKPQSVIHSVREGREITYYPTENEMEFLTSAKDGWGVYEELESGDLLGIITNCRAHDNLSLENMGEKAQLIAMFINRELKNGESTSYSGYLVIPHSVDDLPLLTGLSKDLE